MPDICVAPYRTLGSDQIPMNTFSQCQMDLMFGPVQNVHT